MLMPDARCRWPVKTGRSSFTGHWHPASGIRSLNRAVKRNRDRFPPDFMFRLTAEESEILRCQFGTSRREDGHGGRRYLPYSFTEHGVAMLSSVLRSKRAVQINILIVRAFIKMRELLATHKDLAHKMEELERNTEGAGCPHRSDLEHVGPTQRG